MTDIPALVRPDFFAGQPLTAADLTAVADYQRELLFVHQRTLHGWGIATGLGVSGGAAGDRAVTVQPGVAFDDAGRTIVLDRAREVPVPAVAGDAGGQPVTYYLTASYVEDADQPPLTRAGSCGSSGAVRRPDAPRIRWQQPTDRDPGTGYRFGSDVVLGTATVAACRLAAAVSPAGRRSALPDHQPYVYAGQTDPGATAWTVWTAADDGLAADPAEVPPLGLRAQVDTGEAGFATTPSYFAHVVGARTLTGPDGAPAVVDGYASVTAASVAGFELRVNLPAAGDRWNPRELLTADTAAALRWYVVWVGVEG